MPTTGIINGRLMRLTLDGDKVIHPTNCSINISVEVRDTASKDIPDGWADGETGQKSWTASAEGLYSQDATIDAEARVAAQAFFDLAEIGDKIDLEMLTGITGDFKYTGLAIITSIDYSFPNNENSTYSVSMTGAGPLTKAAVA